MLWLAVAGTIGLLGRMWFQQSDLGNTREQLALQREQARREGVPIDFAQLHPHPIPATQNAALAFIGAALEVAVYRPSRYERLQGLNLRDKATLRRRLKAYGPVLEQVSKAANRQRLI